MNTTTSAPQPGKKSKSLTSQKISLNINGQKYELEVTPNTSLLDALRHYLGLTGTKKGCDHGQCGACTVLVNGNNVNSCLCLAVMQERKEIMTIEGVSQDEDLHPLQEAFIKYDAYQCGYCTSGQICSAMGMLHRDKGNTPEELRDLMSGNICRCGAYINIYEAVSAVKDHQNKKNSHE